jgi:5'-methylthioinosine phosphorylase
MNQKIAIIGGTGLGRLASLERSGERLVDTPWGRPSAPAVEGRLAGVPILFLARHGNPHTIPPHQVNYRANIDLLRRLGVEQIIAVAAVGGIAPFMAPERLAIPDQLIDYTSGRDHTFHEGEGLQMVTHIDFTRPYSERLRSVMKMAADRIGQPLHDGGCYGATQGPRLETAAEVRRLQRDGCDMVGMTGMPEAALAREAGLEYACCALSANWAAGLVEEEITMEAIDACVARWMLAVERLLVATVEQLSDLG